MNEGPMFKYEEKDNKLFVLAVFLLVAAVIFFSFQMLFVYGPDGDGSQGTSKPITDEGIDDSVVSAKTAFESIGSEFDELVSLI